MVSPTVVNLDQYDTRELFSLEARGVGVYNAKMMIRGNALLSSVFVRAISPGATVKVNYYDTTTGTDSLSERFDLTSHPLITDSQAGQTLRQVVTRIHNKPQIEVIVTGGIVEFGVYLSVISDFPVDLKGSILDGQTANLALDGGLPISVYNPDDGKFYLLQGDEGALASGSNAETPAVSNVIIAAANVEQSHTFPASTKRFFVKPRGAGRINLAHVATQSGTNYITIWPGAVYDSRDVKSKAYTIYFQSPIAGLVVEMEHWS